MPDDYPDFPSCEQMLKYLNAFADHWKIREDIQFNTRVKLVEVLPTLLARVHSLCGYWLLP